MGGGFVVESFCDLALDSTELLESFKDSVCDSAFSAISIRRDSVRLVSFI